jgi:tetratricopeptide (TPR) repeat protein
MRTGNHLHFLLIIAAVLTVTAARADDRNLLPKYGSLAKADWQNAADDAFLTATDQEYRGDRRKASQDTALRGWQYLVDGNSDDAMRRFNQAWLLNNKNGTALWGMAAIESDKGKYKESIALFEEAEQYISDEINFSVDYARALGMAGVQLKDEDLLKKAFSRFKTNHDKAPYNTRNLQNWALILFKLQKYADAWAKVKLAEATPDKMNLDPKFIKALQAKMPRPKD